MSLLNSKKKKVAFGLFGICAIVTSFCFCISNSSNNIPLTLGTDENIVNFDKNTNLFTNDTTTVLLSGNGTVKSLRGTNLDFSYLNINNQLGHNWHTLATGGYFKNTSIIKGLKKLTMSFEHPDIKFKISWSERSDFSPCYSSEFITNTTDGIVCNFDNCSPNYFKVENNETNWISILSMSLTFSCSDEYSDIERREMYLEKHKYGESIKYSDSIKNKVSNYYGVSDRSKYHMQNEDFSLNYDLTGAKKRVTDFSSASTGKTYVSDSFEPYIISGDKKCYSSDSVKMGRNNTYDMGYYYYNTHILDQTFGDPSSGVTKYNNLLKSTNVESHYDVSDIKWSILGVLSFNVTSSFDPQIVFKANYSASDYNYLHVKIKSTKSTSFGIYMASSVSSFCSEQFMSCKIKNDGEFNDYYLPISNLPNYSGTITKLRIDVGSVGEKIEISQFRVFNSKNAVSSDFALDRSYHIYSDKLYEENTVVSLKEGASIDGIGQEIKIEKSKTNSILVKDLSMNYKENTGLAGPNTACAFNISNVGIFGIILPYDKSYTLSISSDNTHYFINIISNSGTKSYSYLAKETMSFRIYNDDSADFENFKNEVYIEHNPISPSIFLVEDSSESLGYNSTKGCYDFKIKGADLNYLYYTAPYRQFKINALFASEIDRKIYMSGNSYNNGGFLESSVILDDENKLLPIQVEVCKNFQGEKEESIYEPEDTLYGRSIAPLNLEKGTQTKLTMVHLYQKWGQFDVKQLSSIRFYSEYYHLSTGLTETNCIAPEKDNYLPDFRSMSAPLWKGQPQHTSFGSNKLTKYTDSNGNYQDMIHLDDEIISSGPTYADIVLNNISTDNKIKATYRHLEMPQTDENRTYYEIDYEVLDTVTINDFKNNFSIFSCNTRAEEYASYGYLDANNVSQIVTKTNESDFNDFVQLGTNYPYFDIFNCTDTDDYVNLGIIVKGSDLKINGTNTTTNFVARNRFSTTEGCNYVDLSLNLDNVTLKKGDHLYFDIILVPWGSQESTDDSNVRNIREDSCLYPFNTSTTLGEVISDTYQPKIKADYSSQSAIFTVSEGRNLVTPRIYNFNQIGRPVVKELVNGNWVDYTYKYYEYDGYSVYIEDDKTYSYSFPINMGNTLHNSRTFKVSIA